MYNPTARKTAKLLSLAGLARQRAREGHASLPRQLGEMVWLWCANGMTAPDYFCTGLYRTSLSRREKAEHLGSAKYMRGLRRVNDKRYDYLALNKLAGYGLMRTFSIPTPVVHAVIGRTGGRASDGRRIDSPDGLATVIRAINEPEVCFKLVHGWSGRGFVRARVHDSGDAMTLTTEPGHRTIALGDFWTDVLCDGGTYMVQSLVRGHEDLAALNPSCLNTVRLWMVRDGGGGWEPFGAVLRIGVGDVAVDNKPRHSIYAPVALATGRLGVAIDESVDRNEFRSHPETGKAIEGLVLPKWADVLTLCRRASDLMPYLRLIGFDAAITPTGVMVMEMESVPGDDQVGFDRGVKSLFARLSDQAPESATSASASSTVSTADTMV